MAASLLALCLFALPAHAHVGSPNVFYEGKAGPHPLRVIIRPPAALPGMAQVDVRADEAGITRVSLRAIFFEAGEEAAPPPLEATRVTGEAHLFHAPLWLLRKGSYNIEVTVESPRGRGSVAIPLTSAATQNPAMPPALGAALAVSGGLLFVSAVWIAGAAARSRKIALGTALLLAGTLGAGTARWRKMDREFRHNALARPLPVIANISDDGPVHRLRLTPPPEMEGWQTLVADHGKLMHLFLVREPDHNVFAHLHPVRRDARIFENVLPALPAGTYQLYGEITRENGASETLLTSVQIPAPLGAAAQAALDPKMLNEVICQSPVAPAGSEAQPFTLDADDSWHVSPPPPRADSVRAQVSRLMEGGTMVFENAGDLVENRETSLRFSAFTASGERAAIQGYMGMRGHAVVRREDGAVFTHLHPLGTISMAAQDLLQPPKNETRETVDPTAAVCFPYAFPRSGRYRVWTQMRVEGRVLTGVFEIEIAAAAP